MSIKGAKGSIIYFEVHEEFSLVAMTEAAEMISQVIDVGATNKVGWSFNNDLAQDQVKVTLVVTGFEKQILQKEESDTPKLQKNTSVSIRKVSGISEGFIINEHDLDSPTFLRNQMD